MTNYWNQIKSGASFFAGFFNWFLPPKRSFFLVLPGCLNPGIIEQDVQWFNVWLEFELCYVQRTDSLEGGFCQQLVLLLTDTHTDTHTAGMQQSLPLCDKNWLSGRKLVQQLVFNWADWWCYWCRRWWWWWYWCWVHCVYESLCWFASAQL